MSLVSNSVNSIPLCGVTPNPLVGPTKTGVSFFSADVFEKWDILNAFGSNGCYDYQFKAVVPLKSSLVDKVFQCVKGSLVNNMGEILPSGKKMGLNSAVDFQNLRKDALSASPKFMSNLKRIGTETGAAVSFGPGDQFVVKGENSLKEKIENDSRIEKLSLQEATQKIGDALRGTLIVDSEEQVQDVVTKINTWVQQEGGEITWKNVFREERKNGYVGIHAKILVPFITSEGERRQVLAEVQVHFRSIMDGSLQCPKERAHLSYKSDISTLSPSEVFRLNIINKLDFLSGLMSVGEQCADPKEVLEQCEKTTALPTNLCEDPKKKYLCEGNLGIPRAQMPQVPSDVRKKFILFKKEQGIKVEDRSVPADRLTAVQNQLSRELIDRTINLVGEGLFDPCKNSILVSSSNKDGRLYVLDGHHRYAACRLIDGDQKVVAIDDDVNTILTELDSFPGVGKADQEI